ncbi:hypothetical protein LguiB_020232 [Lonicera macranthoides]
MPLIGERCSLLGRMWGGGGAIYRAESRGRRWLRCRIRHHLLGQMLRISLTACKPIHQMAQHGAGSSRHSLKDVSINIVSDAEDESPQINNPILDSSKPPRRRNKSREDEEGEVQVTQCSSNAKFRPDTNVFIKSSKTRLEDPNWMYDRMSKASRNKKIDDWFLDDDFFDDFHLKNWSRSTVIQWVIFLLIMATLACTLSIPKLKERNLWDLQLWKWELMILVIICGHLVSGWGIRIIVFFLERHFLMKIRVLYFVYGMRKAVQNCLWLALVLVSWHYLVADKIARGTQSKVLNTLTKILVCLLVGTLIWLVKTLIVKVLASSFHVSAFFERIQMSLLKQYVIKKLSGRPLYDKGSDQDEERINAEEKNKDKLLRAESRRHREDNTIDRLQQLNKNNVSAKKMKRLISLVQSGVISKLSTLDEDLPDLTDEDESSLRTRDEREAKALSKKIFPNVAKPGSKNIYLDDLKRFIREDKVEQAKALFEGSIQRGVISEESFTIWMIDAFRQRRTIALSLDDTKTAVDDLHQMLNMIVSVIIIVVWLIILGVAVNHFLILIGSQVLVAVFVFGNSCKTVFEAIIFLFVMHPYDVGDRCEIDGVQMVVEEMNILTTVFLRYDQQIVIYPNSVLLTKPIGNYFRSPGMGDAVEFSIHVSTPWKKIEDMKQRIVGYIVNKSDHWYGDPVVMVKDVEDMNRLTMVVWPRHLINHQDMGLRWRRRAMLVEEMIKIFRELNIEYRMLPVDMNLRTMPPLASDRVPSNWSTCAA